MEWQYAVEWNVHPLYMVPCPYHDLGVRTDARPKLEIEINKAKRKNVPFAHLKWNVSNIFFHTIKYLMKANSILILLNNLKFTFLLVILT